MLRMFLNLNLINVGTKEDNNAQIFSFSSKLRPVSPLQTGSGQNVPADHKFYS